MTGNGLRVLLADADAGLRAAMASALDGAGYAVLCVADGPEATRRAEAGDADLLVADVSPALDGAALADRLRDRQPALPIIFVTSTPDQVTDRNWEPPCYCLAKPFAAAVLLEVAARMLSRPHG